MVAACGTLQEVMRKVLGSLRIRCSKPLAHALLVGLRPMALGTAAFTLANPSAALAADPEQRTYHSFAPHVAAAAQRFGISERWIWAVMHQESRGTIRARSPVGAQGLMQIMPATWAMLTARYGLGSDPYDVQANILAGAAYLRLMWERYRDVGLMLAAYNAGPGRTDAYVAGRSSLPSETVNYVARIASLLGSSSVASRAAMPSTSAPSWRGSGLFIGRPEITPVAIQKAQATQTARTSDARPDAIHPLFFDIAGNSR